MSAPALALGFDVILRLGPAAAVAEPILDRGPHPYSLVPEQTTCTRCGGGILHPVHRPERTTAQKRTL
jgi:hypothetical protein